MMSKPAQYDVEHIKENTDMVELCRALGLDVDRKGKVARCPAHDDRAGGRPNLAIYADAVHCFNCQFHADAVGLVMKVLNYDFPRATTYLADRLGIQPPADSTPSRGPGLGNGKGSKSGSSFPKLSPAPVVTLPPASPASLGNEPGGITATPYPNPDGQPWPAGFPADIVERYVKGYAGLPVDEEEAYALWEEVDRLVVKATISPEEDAWLDWLSRRVAYRGAKPPVAGIKRTLRVQLFDALLQYTKPAAGADPTEGARWLLAEKGITYATQERFNLRWIDDYHAADAGLKRTFGADVLTEYGLLSKKGNLVFWAHRLIFPFYWKGDVVDVQGRNIHAKDKNQRFQNTRGANPLPYNADDIRRAREDDAPIYVCEGATDTMTLAQSGRHVIGIVGTGGFKPAWVEALDGLDVFLALDNDQAGRNAAAKIAKVFLDNGRAVPQYVILPDGVKDVNEFFRRNEEQCNF